MALDDRSHTEYGKAKEAAGTALLKQIAERVEAYEDPRALRELAEAYALVSGTFTGGTKVNVKS